MWPLYKGKNNQIQILSKRYMRHNFIPMNGKNELLDFVELMFSNFLLGITPGCYPTWPSPTPLDGQLGFLPYPTNGNEACTIHCNNSSSSSKNNSSSSASALNGLCTDKLWTMYFNRSKTQDDSRAECILTDPNYKNYMISSHLEFKCTKNVAKYEALMLGM